MAISNTKLRADLADAEGRRLSGGIDCGIEILADCTSAELAKGGDALSSGNAPGLLPLLNLGSPHARRSGRKSSIAEKGA